MSSLTWMKKANVRIFILSVTLLVLATNSHAQYQISLTSSHLFGDTNYRYDALTVNQQAPYDTFAIASKLKFPLDSWLVGVSVDWTLPGGKWELLAEGAINLNDPAQKMTDSDWQRGRKIQYTESNADLNMFTTALTGRRRLFSAGPIPVKLLASVSYQHIAENMTGFEGWYYSISLQRNLPISGTEPTMKYKVDYFSPQAGLSADLQLPFGLILNAQSTAGAVFAWDKNDHLLRGKRSEGSAIGFGTDSEIGLTCVPGFLPKRDFLIRLFGHFRYYHAEGNQTQTWYQDEGEITAGTVLRDLPHEFESYQYSVGLQMAGIIGR